MDITSVLKAKNFFRFTGPPEHWLTAVKYMTWGLNRNRKEEWAKLRSGDIFFIHSTGSQHSAFKNAKSGIIGLGVIGPDFSIKKSLLWFDEVRTNKNTWPFLIPLSEIYLFSKLPPVNTWENPSPRNIDTTTKLINLLLENSIPLSQIPGFPWMGSFSGVKSEVANKILFDKKPLYPYTAFEELKESEVDQTYNIGRTIDKRQFEKINSATEALRYADTLEFIDKVESRVIREPTSQYVRDNELLDLANSTHSSILQQLIDLFQKHGYDTLRGHKSIDLFAHNKNSAFIFEVKSNENRNFRSQARKGIAQLFEYEYFDVQKFAEDNNLVFDQKHKLIVPSQTPKDTRYVEFINSLKIGVAMAGEDNLKPVGTDFGFSKI